MNIDQIWATLGVQQVEEHEVRSVPLTSGAASPLLLGADSAGLPHLIIRSPSLTVVELDRRSRGVWVEPKELLLDRAAPEPVLDISCKDGRLTPVFKRLVEEMLTASDQTDSGDTIATCLRVLADWRDLLDPERRPLGPDGELGLFGELSLLARLLDLNPAASVRSWTGPRRRPHDFTTDVEALEVKTSPRREGRQVTIHGLGQLDEPEGLRLHLVYMGVQEDGAGASVDSLVEVLLRKVADPSLFRELLACAGWAPGCHKKWSIRELSLFRVDQAFPRIVPDSFVGGRAPAGVTSIRYTLDLTGPYPPPLDSDAVEEVLGAVAQW